MKSGMVFIYTCKIRQYWSRPHQCSKYSYCRNGFGLLSTERHSKQAQNRTTSILDEKCRKTNLKSTFNRNPFLKCLRSTGIRKDFYVAASPSFERVLLLGCSLIRAFKSCRNMNYMRRLFSWWIPQTNIELTSRKMFSENLQSLSFYVHFLQ